jgi:uncharacterized membrane protein
VARGGSSLDGINCANHNIIVLRALMRCRDPSARAILNFSRFAASEVPLSHGDDPAPTTPGEAADSRAAKSEGLRLPDPGPVAEAAEDEGRTGEEHAGPSRSGEAGLAARGGSNIGSDADGPSQFTESLAFQAELVAWQGPLPPPQVLGEYENIVPGSALRILAMAETVISGPVQNAAKLTDAEVEGSRRGLAFAMVLTSATFVVSVGFFILAVLGVGSTAACITAGSVFLSVPVIMLVRSFITRS